MKRSVFFARDAKQCSMSAFVRCLLVSGRFWHGSSMISLCIFFSRLFLILSTFFYFLNFRLQIKVNFLASNIFIQLTSSNLLCRIVASSNLTSIGWIISSIFVKLFLFSNVWLFHLFQLFFSLLSLDFAYFIFSMKKYGSNLCQIQQIHSASIHIECDISNNEL